MKSMEANENPRHPQPESPAPSEKLSLDHALLSYELALSRSLYYRCGRCFWRVPEDYLAGKEPVCPREQCGAKWRYLGYFLSFDPPQNIPYGLTAFSGAIIKAESTRGPIRQDFFRAPAYRGDTEPGWTQKIKDVPLTDQQPYL